MSIAIPLVAALGGLYIISNQENNKPSNKLASKNSRKEGFTSSSSLPNTDIPDKNYPNLVATSTAVVPETEITSQLMTVNAYNGTGAYSDKYFNNGASDSSLVSDTIAKDTNSYYSLTGEKVDASYFQHQNMMPFFGSKLRSVDTNNTSNESILDNYLGNGSQTIRKQAQAPLFAPAEKMHWTHGAPNMNDFYQGRVNTSMRRAGELPFEQVRVGPGLGLGATADGAGGYNSGTMMREAWMDKSVDDLRTASKPKSSEHMVLGFEGPAAARMKNIGYQAPVPKNRPDRYAETGHDRLFTTTGVEKGPTLHSIPMERDQARQETTTSYHGVAQSQMPALAANPSEHMPTHRNEYGEYQLGAASAVGRQFATDGDYGIKTKMAYPTNRSIYQEQLANAESETYFGAIGSGLGAVVAPLLEIMRPSRRENAIGNMRLYGDAKTTVGGAHLFNPSDAPKQTIKETTLYDPNSFNSVDRGQKTNGYINQDIQLLPQERESTHSSYTGNAKYGRGPKPYDDAYNYEVKGLRSATIDNRMVDGNMKLFNGNINYQGKPKDLDTVNQRDLVPKMPYQYGDQSAMGNIMQRQETMTDMTGRNDPGLYSALSQNPYTLQRKYNI